MTHKRQEDAVPPAFPMPARYRAAQRAMRSPIFFCFTRPMVPVTARGQAMMKVPVAIRALLLSQRSAPA